MRQMILTIAVAMVTWSAGGVAALQQMPPPKPKPPVRNGGAASPSSRPAGPAEEAAGSLLVEVDMDCRVKLDGVELGGVFKVGELRKTPVSAGEHIVEAMSLEGGYRWRGDVKVERSQQAIVRTRLVAEKGKAEESARQASAALRRAVEAQAEKERKDQARKAALASLRREFVRIPAGEFQMGSNNGDDDEKPEHRVRISQGFEMGKYEVTQKQWQAVVGTNPSGFQDCGFDCPVENVSWNDVQEFLKRLNALDPGRGYRLPTEAEWEYAARAGTTGMYAGELEEMGWYDKNSGGMTHPVGQKKANGWGLHDMHGNVWEWCQDRHGDNYYQNSPGIDPKGPDTGELRVLRGGSWSLNARHLRSSIRYLYSSDNRIPLYGFRLVRSAARTSQ